MSQEDFESKTSDGLKRDDTYESEQVAKLEKSADDKKDFIGFETEEVPENHSVFQGEAYRPISRKHVKRNGIVILLCLFIGFVSGVLGGVSYNYFFQNALDSNTSSTEQISDLIELSSAKVVELVADSVVDVSTDSATPDVKGKAVISASAGSGVVYSSDGYIVTNEHVVREKGRITVTLKNGRSYSANIVGTDKNADIALLKIGASDLTPAVFADSSKVKLGEESLVIGNPLGELSGTVTDGVVSAIDREVEVEGKKMTLLQTCAEINSGNSGGGVFKRTGELIGIVVAKSAGDDIEGLGFAIPASTVKTVVKNLLPQ